jgi:JAB N-terminal domain
VSFAVEIFRTDDYLPEGELPLLPVILERFKAIIGADQRGIACELSFVKLADLTLDSGQPAVSNLRPAYGFVQVRIRRNGQLLYQHPHPVREVVGHPLRQILRSRAPEVTHWGYRLRGPGLQGAALTRPAPQVSHEVKIALGGQRRPAFSVEELPEPDPPESSLGALGVPPAVREPSPPADGPLVTVAIDALLVTALTRTLPFSAETEEGGFLAGTVYRDADNAGGYIVHVTAVMPAERTGASLINFTFTGESFLRVGEQLAARSKEKTLLGWYHTHLFPATERFGLSSVDVELQASTFRRPWQVAALVNIGEHDRLLRMYHGSGAEMTQVPYYAVSSPGLSRSPEESNAS